MRANVRVDRDDLMLAKVIRRYEYGGERPLSREEEIDALADLWAFLIVLGILLTFIALLGASQLGWWGDTHASDVRNAEHQDRQGGATDPQRDSSGADYSIQS